MRVYGSSLGIVGLNPFLEEPKEKPLVGIRQVAMTEHPVLGGRVAWRAMVGGRRVLERDGEFWTTSLDVARVFEKEHRHILEAIKNLECSQVFRDVNFNVSSYQSEQNKTMPMFEITQDGFAFLAMGFTGKRAAQFKEWYIEQFNSMRAQLRLLQPVVSCPPE